MLELFFMNFIDISKVIFNLKNNSDKFLTKIAELLEIWRGLWFNLGYLDYNVVLESCKHVIN